MGGDHGQFLGAFVKLQKSNISFVMSVHLSARNNSTPTTRIITKFDLMFAWLCIIDVNNIDNQLDATVTVY